MTVISRNGDLDPEFYLGLSVLLHGKGSLVFEDLAVQADPVTQTLLESAQLSEQGAGKVPRVPSLLVDVEVLIVNRLALSFKDLLKSF